MKLEEACAEFADLLRHLLPLCTAYRSVWWLRLDPRDVGRLEALEARYADVPDGALLRQTVRDFRAVVEAGLRGEEGRAEHLPEARILQAWTAANCAGLLH